ncbi:hypothetical protein ACGC1H_004079 [Rhizoctonia solani]
MSSQDPSNERGKRGIGKKISKWFKGIGRRSSSARPSSGNSEHLSVPGTGSQTELLSRTATPSIALSPHADLEPKRGLTPAGLSTQASIPKIETKTLTMDKRAAALGVDSQAVSHSRLATPAPNSPLPLVDPGLDREAATPPSEPSTQAIVSETEANTGPEHKKSDSVAWNRTIGSLRILESSMRSFPPLKSAVSALIGCLDTVRNAASNRSDYEDLADELQLMANILNQYAGELELEPSNGSIANIAQCIQQQVTEIERKQGSGTIGRLLDVTQDQEDVIRRYRQVERLFRQLQADLSMRARNDVKKQLETTLLRGMYPVDDAKYDSGYSTTIRRRACTAKTREAVLETLQNWTTNLKSRKIYWMNGMAGTGKTTIAYSFCEWLKLTNRLGASFFCSRISSTCRSLIQIVPTIAYQLARFSPAFRSKLCVVLNDDPDGGRLNVAQQFEKLVNQPMLNAKNAMPDSVVIVIDALDECDDNYSVRLLLDLLLKFAEHLPLKFFVSSRPEPIIRERMMSQGGTSRSIVYLHDIEESIVEEDIKKYITEALTFMTPPPSSKQVGILAKRSRNLFIYAATVVRYIYLDDTSVDSSARLESILEAIGSARAMSSNRYEDLDLLYTTVLGAVFKTRLEEEEKGRMRRVLRTVVCAREPITAVTIAALAKLTERQVWSALQSLRSIVHVPENSNLISTLHASFPEYMLDESRSKELCCNEASSNETMVHRCFDVMKSELKFNICALGNSYLMDDQVHDLETRVTRYISPTLSYVCRYWASHLRVSPASGDTNQMVLEFLSDRLLFWMEVLSLSRCIGTGAPMIQQAQTWLRIEDNRDEVQKQTSDARNFVTWFAANLCSRSTPHIYISALAMCAKSSWVYQHYIQRTKAVASISVSQHDEAVLAIWSLEYGAPSGAISSDGNRLASGSFDGSVRVYDMHTGAVVAGPFQGHSDAVYLVAFSHDMRHIASGSDDNTVIIWDADTGRIITGPLDRHTGRVWSVAFSPDGKHVVSGSEDRTVIVWDAYTGAIIHGPLAGHSDRIMSVAFSPDGKLIASGSKDHTIILRAALTGVAVADPLKGHEAEVTMVAFSPDGRKLASCSGDKTVRVWDTTTGTIIGLPFKGHQGIVRSINFSHNSRWIVSGGYNDYNIIVWDALTGLAVLGPFSGHTGFVSSVEFTPDDTRIVSCSGDRTIRIWDAQPESKSPGQQTVREISIGPVVFLRDYTQFISNSSNDRLRLWDLHTGKTTSQTFEGQAVIAVPHSIAVSSQHTLVAVGSHDFDIRVWNVLTGKTVSQPLKGHSGPVSCLAFSPDGTRLCSGSDDATIIIWDVPTGVMVGQPHAAHTSAVTSVAYSPDATCVASGSIDYTIRLWDLSTGVLVHTLDGHNAPVSSVAFSPDGGLIASGSIDGIVRKWDAGGGNCLATFLKSKSPSYLNSNSDRSMHCNGVCFSPDGTCIVSGFGSSIRLIDTQIIQLISELSLPPSERVCWVGYSPDGSNIISVSVSQAAKAEAVTKDFIQPSPQSPNIIRVWHAAAQRDQSALSSTPLGWSYRRDGRILSPEGLLVMWIPPDLIPHMEAHTELESESYYSPLVLSSNGLINVGYPELFIGNRWTECYGSESAM